MMAHSVSKAFTIATLAVMALGIADATAETTVTYNTIAMWNDPVPGGNGWFTSFGPPQLNNAGHVLFFDSVFDGPSGLFLYVGDEIVPVVRAGDPTPDGNGSFDRFLLSILNDAGQVFFCAELKDTFLGHHDNVGYYLYTRGRLKKIVRENDELPDREGRFERFFQMSLNGAGQVVSYPDLWPRGTLFLHDSTGPRTFFDASMLGSSGGLSSWVGLNSSGEVAVGLEVDGLRTIGLFGDSGWRQLVQEGDPVPDGDASFSSSIDLIDLNAAGQIIFREGAGRYMHNGSGVVKVVRSGDSAPDGNGVFWPIAQDLLDVVIGTDGKVAFIDHLRETSAFELDDTAVYLYDGAKLVTIAREGDPLPEGGGFFGNFDSDRVGPVLNTHGQVAFAGNAKAKHGDGDGRPGGGTQRLYATDRDGVLRFVVGIGLELNVGSAARGDMREISPNDRRGTGVQVISESSGGEDGRRRFFNDDGTLAFKLEFTDGTEGIFTATVGEPGPLTDEADLVDNPGSLPESERVTGGPVSEDGAGDILDSGQIPRASAPIRACGAMGAIMMPFLSLLFAVSLAKRRAA